MSPSSLSSRREPGLHQGLLLLLAGLLCAMADTPAATGPPLHDGLTLEREIQGGETQAFPVDLQGGQFLRVTVQEDGIDLGVRLLDPQGALIAVADSLSFGRPEAPEDLAAAVERAGPYRIEVVASGRQPGRYRLSVEGPRAPGAADRIRAAAVQATWRGMVEPAGSDDEQIRVLERAATLWEELGERRKEAQILWTLGGKRHDYAEAAGEYQRSATLWAGEKDVKSRAWEGRALAAEGVSLRKAERIAAARTCFEKALDLARKAGDEDGMGAALGSLGALTADQGEVRRGIEIELQGLELVRKAGNGKTEATILDNLAIHHQTIAENQKAVRYHEQALTLARSHGDRVQEGQVLNNLAYLYNELGDFDKALSHWQEALELASSGADLHRQAITLNNLGAVCQRLGRYKEARRYFGQALALARQVGSREVEVSSLDNQAFLALRLQEPAQALKLARQALPLSQGSRAREAFTQFALGSAYCDLKRWPEARQELAAARELYRQRGDVLKEADAILALTRVEHRSGNLDAALARIRSAIDLVESARSRVVSHDLRASFSAARQDFYEVQIDILMALQDQGRDGFAAAALQASERARARILLEVLTETDLRTGADSALIERERSLRDEINTRESQRIQLLREENPDPAGLTVARRRIDEALEELQQVEASLRESSPHYADLTQPQPLTAAEIQAQVLDGRALLLEYALGAQRSFLWAVGPDKVETFRLSGREAIERVARQYYELLTARNHPQSGETVAARKERIAAADREAERVGRELSRMILSPVEKRLGDRPLLVITEGALQYIPFSALPLPSSGAPLASRHEVVSLPSATALAALRRELRERKPAPRELAIFADPVFQQSDSRLHPTGGRPAKPQPAADESPRLRSAPEPRAGGESGIDVSRLRRLPLSEKEAETIAALLPPDQVFKALGLAATKAAVTRGDMDGYRKLHFATHGLLDSRHPELSGVALSQYDSRGQFQDGVLRLNDIYNLRLDADLVVLSACRTALGKEVRGEGLIGLTRGFMYAGAARVLASLWSVEDRATAELMGSFYRGMLREGLSPAAALRKAQLEMARDPQRKSPYFWAGFSLQGEWR
jgi:CHAT domain-containing protein/Tfp pilus assembly protein PilF